MSNPSVENVYTRQTAKELTKKYFWKLLGMMAIVFGIVYAVTLGGGALLALVGNEAVMVIGTIVLMVVMMLVSCGMMMGLISAMIDLCRGDETVTVGRVFSRMGQSLKAFGLSMWVSLKMILWMLPGYAVVFASLAFVTSSVNPTTGTIPESAATLMTVLPVIGMILLLGLMIPAAFRYMLSNYILADKPETGVFECVRQSKAMMKGHKWQAFKLIVPIILIMYVVILVISVALGALMGLAADSAAVMSILSIVMIIVMFAAFLYYAIRMYLCYALFYLKRTEDAVQAE